MSGLSFTDVTSELEGVLDDFAAGQLIKGEQYGMFDLMTAMQASRDLMHSLCIKLTSQPSRSAMLAPTRTCSKRTLTNSCQPSSQSMIPRQQSWSSSRTSSFVTR